jgi:hypothetical protein
VLPIALYHLSFMRRILIVRISSYLHSNPPPSCVEKVDWCLSGFANTLPRSVAPFQHILYPTLGSMAKEYRLKNNVLALSSH